MTGDLKELQGQKFRCIVADPPWEHKGTGACRGRKPTPGVRAID